MSIDSNEYRLAKVLVVLREAPMLKTTRDMIMPTAITGSYPRPL